MQKSEDELLPHYLVVANTANDTAKVAQGNDKVMRARLADARFFYEVDKKANITLGEPIPHRVEFAK